MAAFLENWSNVDCCPISGYSTSVQGNLEYNLEDWSNDVTGLFENSSTYGIRTTCLMDLI